MSSGDERDASPMAVASGFSGAAASASPSPLSSSPVHSAEDLTQQIRGGEEDEDQLLQSPTMTTDDPRLPPIPPMPRGEQRTEWLAQFQHSPSSFNTRAVHRSVDDRGLRGSHLRSVYWKLFLGELDKADMAAWPTGIAARRDDYAQLCTKHRVKPVALQGPSSPLAPGERSRSSSSAVPASAEVDLRTHNPLSQSKENPWTQYFCDNELSETIRHDLHRTHAEQDFFVSPVVQDIMFNVLFLWAKEIGNDKDGRYRQGMNEILSCIILVCMRESQWVESWPTDAEAAPTDQLLAQVLDRTGVEADVYHLFCRVMAQIGQYYVKVDVNPRAAAAARKKAAIVSGDGGADAATLIDQTPIVNKCHYIFHILLSTLDPQLYAHLIAMDVAPNLYILRWYRLMLCREFHLEDTLVIWDVTFATAEQPPIAPASAATDDEVPLHSNAFVLTEYMCISMLLYVRQALLQGDNIFCLRRLLRYPPVEDVRVLLARALHFHNSWKLIVSDPTVTREVFDPTKVTDAERGGASSGENLSGAFDGPWQTLTEDMGADAPLEDPLAAAAHNTRPRAAHTPHVFVGQPRAPNSHAPLSAKSLLQDGFSSLKSFVKGVTLKAGEVPAGAHATTYNTTTSKPQLTAGTVVKRHATLPASNSSSSNNGNRKLPQATGVSHFLSSSSFSSSTPSPSPPAASVASSAASRNEPTEKEHDELVLLRKQLRATEKERDAAIEATRTIASQLADATTVQKQMGALMDDVLRGLEHEWEVTSAEAVAPVKRKNTTDDANVEAEAIAAVAVADTPAAAPSRPFSEDMLLRGLAELKHIKDVLIGRLALSDIIEHLQSSASPATAASSTAESTTPTGSPSASPRPSASPSRTQLIQDMAAIHARQVAAAATAAAPDSSSCFPYNIPPPAPIAKKKEALFEPETKARDIVGELFELSESDAMPGLYPTVHKVTLTDKIDEEPLISAVPSPVAAVASDPLMGARTASASPPASAPFTLPVSNPAPTVTASAPPPTVTSSAVTKQLLSGLLSSTPPKSSNSVSSLFAISPPSSPFGPTGAGAKLRVGGVFDLEHADDDIFLPSSAQFKAKTKNTTKAGDAAEPSTSLFAAPSTSSNTSATTSTTSRVFVDPLSSADPMEDWLK